MNLGVLDIIVLASWSFPIILLILAVIGFAKAFTVQYAGFYTNKMVIQITSINNYETTNSIIKAIRSYSLGLPIQIWVVSEPGFGSGFVGADEVFEVPASFTSDASYKARALDYSAKIRAQRGLNGENTKILFLDDDSLPTADYIIQAFDSPADICEGIISPRKNYGSAWSHLDNLRTINCLTICSFFQGLGQPVHVHGEGLCVRGHVEAAVTWNWPVFASEDLVFGHKAAQMGFKWGFIPAVISIASPLSLTDVITQRRRWLWGNIHAVRNVLSLKSSIILVTKYFLGSASLIVSTAGIILRLTGVVDYPLFIEFALYSSLAIWLGLFAAAGVINSGANKLAVLVAVLSAWLAALLGFIVLVVSLAKGNPRRFDVISKQ